MEFGNNMIKMNVPTIVDVWLLQLGSLMCRSDQLRSPHILATEQPRGGHRRGNRTGKPPPRPRSAVEPALRRGWACGVSAQPGGPARSWSPPTELHRRHGFARRLVAGRTEEGPRYSGDETASGELFMPTPGKQGGWWICEEGGHYEMLIRLRPTQIKKKSSQFVHSSTK